MPLLIPLLKWGMVAAAGALGFAYTMRTEDAPETVAERQEARRGYGWVVFAVAGLAALVFLGRR